MRDLYSENYKTLMKEVEDDTHKKMEKYSMIMDRKKPILLKCSYYSNNLQN